MTRLAASQVRERFSDTVNRVAYTGERVVIERKGKEAVAIVTIEDLKLLEALEDREDLEAIREALKDPRRIPYSEVRRKLGLE